MKIRAVTRTRGAAGRVIGMTMLAAALAATPSAVSPDAPAPAPQRATASSTERQSVRVPRGSTLDLRNISGSVSVRHGSGRTADIVLTHSARASSEARAKAVLATPRIRVNERGDRVSVEALPGRTAGATVVTSMSVEVPDDVDVRITTLAGAVTVDTIAGDVSVETTAGSITMRRVNGLSSAHSLTGSIDISDVEGEQSLEVSSLTGSITLRQVQVRQLAIESVSASIDAADIEASRVEATTTGGSVTFSGTVLRGGRYEFHSHSGSVDLRLGGAGFELDARSVHGSVQAPGLSLSSERRSRTALRGTAGDGAAAVEATTFNGQITIRRR